MIQRNKKKKKNKKGVGLKHDWTWSGPSKVWNRITLLGRSSYWSLENLLATEAREKSNKEREREREPKKNESWLLVIRKECNAGGKRTEGGEHYSLMGMTAYRGRAAHLHCIAPTRQTTGDIIALMFQRSARSLTSRQWWIIPSPVSMREALWLAWPCTNRRVVNIGR